MGLIDKFKNMFTEEVEEDEEVTVSKKISKQIEKQFTLEKEETPKRQTEYSHTATTPTRTTLSRTSSAIDDDDIIVKKYPMTENIVKNEEKVVQTTEEKKPLKREEKFVFPVYFDDKDFKKIENSPKRVEEKKAPEKKEVYGTKIEKKEEPKVFKPTPIISPIYGILDKNYHKDDITSKKVTRKEYRSPSKPLTIDEVRKKAYGTLEDDIETSLFAKSSIFMEPDENKEEKEEIKHNLLTDLVEEKNSSDTSDTIDTISDTKKREYSSVDDFLNSPIEDYDMDNNDDGFEKTKGKSENKHEDKENTLDDLLKLPIDEPDDNLVENYMMNNNSENEETKNIDTDEDLTQSDLFNLIDSMYEKGEDE